MKGLSTFMIVDDLGVCDIPIWDFKPLEVRRSGAYLKAFDSRVASSSERRG